MLFKLCRIRILQAAHLPNGWWVKLTDQMEFFFNGENMTPSNGWNSFKWMNLNPLIGCIWCINYGPKCNDMEIWWMWNELIRWIISLVDEWNNLMKSMLFQIEWYTALSFTSSIK
jgi:hypothetical protein